MRFFFLSEKRRLAFDQIGLIFAGVLLLRYLHDTDRNTKSVTWVPSHAENRLHRPVVRVFFFCRPVVLICASSPRTRQGMPGRQECWSKKIFSRKRGKKVESKIVAIQPPNPLHTRRTSNFMLFNARSLDNIKALSTHSQRNSREFGSKCHRVYVLPCLCAVSYTHLTLPTRRTV